MRRGAFANAQNETLSFLLKAWCLCVEIGAGNLADGEIERQLFANDSNGRQLARWKAGTMPPAKELELATSAAITKRWIPKRLGKAIDAAYTARRGARSTEESRSGWDEIAALQLTIKHAEKTGHEALTKHCEAWERWVDGPGEKDPKELNAWLAKHDKRWTIDDEDEWRDSVVYHLEQAMLAGHYAGFTNPGTFVRSNLHDVIKNWPVIAKAYLDKSGARKVRKKKEKK